MSSFWDDHNENMKDPVYRKAFEEATEEIEARLLANESLMARIAENRSKPGRLKKRYRFRALSFSAPKLSPEARARLNGPNPPKLKVDKDHLFPREGC